MPLGMSPQLTAERTPRLRCAPTSGPGRVTITQMPRLARGQAKAEAAPGGSIDHQRHVQECRDQARPIELVSDHMSKIRNTERRWRSIPLKLTDAELLRS